MITIRETRLSPSDAFNKLDVAQLLVVVGQRAALVPRHVSSLREEEGGESATAMLSAAATHLISQSVPPPWWASPSALPVCRAVLSFHHPMNREWLSQFKLSRSPICFVSPIGSTDQLTTATIAVPAAQTLS